MDTSTFVHPRLGDGTPRIRMAGFPARYIQGPGALTCITTVGREMGVGRLFVVRDAGVTDPAVEEVLSELTHKGLLDQEHSFSGECSSEAIGLLAVCVRKSAADGILTIGGGKTLDVARAVAHDLNMQIIVAPSAASSDAPTSRLSIVYGADSHRIMGIRRSNSNPSAVVVDTSVIARSPRRLFAAGIGDALSKVFETELCLRARGHNTFGTPSLDLPLIIATACFDTLLQWGPQAMADLEEAVPTAAIEAVTEATILQSGIGFESGGLSFAHALIRGLTLFPVERPALHGELVGYATLVQLCMEAGKAAEFRKVRKLLEDCGLPTSLTAMGLQRILNTNDLMQVIDAMRAVPYSRNVPFPVSLESLASAMGSVERPLSTENGPGLFPE